MRLLADENVPGDLVAALRERGHDVAWAHTDSPGSRDPEVLARAQAEDRILITFDKDFGELAFRAGLPAASGVVLFRISMPSVAEVVRLAVAALESPIEWAGKFTVVHDRHIRQTALPKRPV